MEYADAIRERCHPRDIPVIIMPTHDDVQSPSAIGDQARELLPTASANGDVRRKVLTNKDQATLLLLATRRPFKKGLRAHDAIASPPAIRSRITVAMRSAISDQSCRHASVRLACCRSTSMADAATVAESPAPSRPRRLRSPRDARTREAPVAALTQPGARRQILVQLERIEVLRIVVHPVRH